MLDNELPQPEAEPAPHDSRGRIVAAVILLVLAAAGMILTTVSQYSAIGREEMRDYQARMNLFTGRILLGLTYDLEGLERDRLAPPRLREIARNYAPLGASSAVGYFERAAQGLASRDQRTAAAASVAALYAHSGNTLRALQFLHEALKTGRPDVLSFMVRLCANERPSAAWLNSQAIKWIPDHVPAHLLIESQIAESLGRRERAAELRQAMYEAGARMAARVGELMLAAGLMVLLGVVVLGWGAARGGFGPYHGLPERRWGLWAGLELVGAWLVLNQVVLNVAAYPLISRAVARGAAYVAACVLGAYAVASFIALAWFVRSVAPAGTGLRGAGWRAVSWGRTLFNGIGAYAAALPAVAVATMLAQRLLPEPPVNFLVAEMTSTHSVAGRALFLVLLCVAAPVAEETVFRGGLFGGMRRRWSLPAAAFASAAIFALVHMNWVSFVPVMALGVALCLVYERTGSLLPGMVAHGLFNLGSALVIFVLS